MTTHGLGEVGVEMSKLATPATRAAIQRVEGLGDKLRVAEQKVSGAIIGLHFAQERGPHAIVVAEAEALDVRHVIARLENELHDARQAERKAWAEAPSKPWDAEAHVRAVNEFYRDRMRRWA